MLRQALQELIQEAKTIKLPAGKKASAAAFQPTPKFTSLCKERAPFYIVFQVIPLGEPCSKCVSLTFSRDCDAPSGLLCKDLSECTTAQKGGGMKLG